MNKILIASLFLVVSCHAGFVGKGTDPKHAARLEDVSAVSNYFGSAFDQLQASGVGANVIVLIHGETKTKYPTIQAAKTASKEGDTILIGPGVYTEDLYIVKPGRTYIGSGTGIWDSSTEEAIGGAIIDGIFRVIAPATNCVFKSLGLKDTLGRDVAFFGSSDSVGVEYNNIVEDVNLYGNGSNTHNTEFRGGKWFVKNVNSFNAGEHSFPIKCFNSRFDGIHVDGGQSGIIIKAHGGVSDVYNLSLKNITITNRKTPTTYSALFIETETGGNCTVSNVVVESGIIDAAGKGGVYIMASTNNAPIDGITLRGLTINNPSYGIEGRNKTPDIGISHVKNLIIQNCTVNNPSNSAFYNQTIPGYAATNIVLDGFCVSGGVSVSGSTNGTVYSRVIEF